MDINYKLWDYLNENRNVLNGDEFVFRIGFPMVLYQFLKHTKKANMENAIALGIAVLYIADPEKRQILKEQVYSPIFKKSEEMIENYFSDLMHNNPRFRDEDTGWYDVRFYQAFVDYIASK